MDEPLIQALVTLAGIAAGAFGAWLQSRGKIALALAAAAQANLKVAELQAAGDSSGLSDRPSSTGDPLHSGNGWGASFPPPATYRANAAPPWEPPITGLREDLDQVETKLCMIETKQNKQAVIIGKLEVKCGLNGRRLTESKE